MSTHYLMSIDGDRLPSIDADAGAFVNALVNFIRHGDEASREALYHDFGVSLYGERHHSSPYHLQWGFSNRHDYTPQGRY